MSDRGIVNSSGFPLQMALRQFVDSQFPLEDDWNTSYEEQAWRHPETNDEGFVDLVFERRLKQVLVVECKRVRDATWCFLSRKNLESEQLESDNLDGWKTALKGSGWSQISAKPHSYLATYCAVTGQGSNDLKRKPLLETIAANLVYATEALAHWERPAYESGIQNNGFPDDGRWYFPIIVTTAALKVARVNAGDIELSTGDIPEISTTKYETVPWVRFRKQVRFREASQNTPSLAGLGIPDGSITLFVVSANNFREFLDSFAKIHISG